MRCTNFPIRQTINDYNIARDEIVQFLKPNQDVVSVCEFGSVSSPGISDLDILLVLNDHTVSASDKFILKNLSKNLYQFLGNGTTPLIQSSLINKLHLLGDFDIHTLYGTDFSIKKTFAKPIEIKISNLMDWLPERILKLLTLKSCKKIDIRKSLCALYSIRYSFNQIDSLLNEGKNSVISHQIKRLRSEWFNLKNPIDDFIKVYNTTIKESFSYLEKLEELYLSRIVNNCVSIDCDKNKKLKLYGNSQFIFDSVRKGTYTTAGGINLYLSNAHLLHWYTQAFFDNELSNEINNRLGLHGVKLNVTLNESYLMFNKEKIDVINDNRAFLKGISSKNGMLKYGFFF